MVSMLVVQAPIDQIVSVVTVRNSLMPATWPMSVRMVVTNVVCYRVATIRIRVADFDHMLINVITMRMMKVSVMQVIDVIAMLHCDMATAGSMCVIVVFVMGQLAIAHVGVMFP